MLDELGFDPLPSPPDLAVELGDIWHALEAQVPGGAFSVLHGARPELAACALRGTYLSTSVL